jgi:hypothetical protein
MIARPLIAACVVVACLAAPALAAEAPRGRGPVTQAAMDAATAERGGAGVQILKQLCEVPARRKACTPITATLQRALERAIDRPITWVAHRHVDGPQFWVFAPVEFEAGRATSEYAWWDTGTLGCRGGITYRWERTSGAWVTTTGLGWAACSGSA